MKLNRKEKISAVVGSVLGIVIGLFLATQSNFVQAHKQGWCTHNCENTYPTPTVFPTDSPVPTDSPTASPSATPEDTSIPEAVVSPTPVDVAPGVAPSDSQCQVVLTPTLLTFTRLSPTSVTVTWSHIDPVTQFVLFFGTTKSNLVWNTGVVNGYSYTLNNLPANASIWVGVKGTDGTCQGAMSNVLDP